MRIVVALWACLLLCNAADAADQRRVVVGIVDGQKFGTNVLGVDVTLTFEADSPQESELLKVCPIGTRCRVEAWFREPGFVTRLLAARPAESEHAAASGASGDLAANGSDGPSFPCSKAKSEVEHLICSSPALARQDQHLAVAYSREVKKAGAGRSALVKTQRNWVNSVRNACHSEQCLARAYAERLSQLAGSQHPKP